MSATHLSMQAGEEQLGSSKIPRLSRFLGDSWTSTPGGLPGLWASLNIGTVLGPGQRLKFQKTSLTPLRKASSSRGFWVSGPPSDSLFHGYAGPVACARLPLRPELSFAAQGADPEQRLPATPTTRRGQPRRGYFKPCRRPATRGPWLIARSQA